jgi:hypothetical protein
MKAQVMQCMFRGSYTSICRSKQFVQSNAVTSYRQQHSVESLGMLSGLGKLRVTMPCTVPSWWGQKLLPAVDWRLSCAGKPFSSRKQA